MSADKPIQELEYKDLIKTGLPVSFGSTHVVLSEMVTEFRNNRCQVVSKLKVYFQSKTFLFFGDSR